VRSGVTVNNIVGRINARIKAGYVNPAGFKPPRPQLRRWSLLLPSMSKSWALLCRRCSSGSKWSLETAVGDPATAC
jgi:hypothetical protein